MMSLLSYSSNSKFFSKQKNFNRNFIKFSKIKDQSNTYYLKLTRPRKRQHLGVWMEDEKEFGQEVLEILLGAQVLKQMTKFYNLSKVLKLNILRKVFEINSLMGSVYLLKITENCIKFISSPKNNEENQSSLL